MSENLKFVSVVIPTYNYGHFLAEAIDSVLNQTFGNFEILVVDNFSTDNTKSLMASYDDNRVHHHLFNNGGSIAAARNYGWSKARGELVAFLDADDSWHPKKLEIQTPKHLGSQPILSHHDLKLTGTRVLGRARGYNLGSKPLIDMLTKGNPILTSSVIVNKNLLEKYGGFPEALDLVAAEDFALWLKMAKNGEHFIHLPKTLGEYRTHDKSSSSKDPTLPAIRVTGPYRKKLSSSQEKNLDGWIAYSRGVHSNKKSEAIKQLALAIGKASLKFKARAAVRLIMKALRIR